MNGIEESYLTGFMAEHGNDPALLLEDPVLHLLQGAPAAHARRDAPIYQRYSVYSRVSAETCIVYYLKASWFLPLN